MRLAMFLPPQPNEMWRLAVQLGVTDTVSGLPRPLSAGLPVWDFSSFLLLKQCFADAGLALSVIESAPPMDRIRLGLPGRDEEIEHICEMLTNMGAVGIGIWCYNFMAVFGWLRTSTTTPARGEALVTSYDHDLMREAPLTEFGIVSEERLWDNFAYFLERVVPVAERARVKLALHPDDPPISPIRGIARIITSVDALKRVIELVPSEWNGLTFCQGTITTMGANIPAAIRFFGERQKIHFVHFRDIRGTASRFVETFQIQLVVFSCASAYIAHCDMNVGMATVPERDRLINACNPGPEGQVYWTTRGSTRPRTWGTATTGGQGSHDQQQDAHHREFYREAACPTHREKMLHCLALLWTRNSTQSQQPSLHYPSIK